MNISNYFSKVSKDYSKRRVKGLFGYLVNIILVNKEKKIVMRKLNPKKNELILDAGCGSGLYSRIMLYSDAKPVGMDISYGMISQYNKNGMLGVMGNIESVPFKAKFDKVLCAGSLEFVNDVNKAINSFNNALKVGGMLVLLYPRLNIFGFLYFIYHKSHGLNIKLFSNKKISKVIGNNGFRVVSINKASLLTKVLVARKYRN